MLACGFDLAASSSRSNSSDAATWRTAGVGAANASLEVRKGPRTYAVIVTQFVTHRTTSTRLPHR